MDYFKASLTHTNPYEKYLTQHFELEDAVTYKENKTLPIYNWFHYKEGYSREFVYMMLDKINLKKDATVLDPFCGTGTTQLATQEKNINSIGTDIMPLCTFVSTVKLRNYNTELLHEAAKNLMTQKFQKPTNKIPEIGFLNIKQAYNRYAREDISFYLNKIHQTQDETIRDFLLLALISIVAQASNIQKDGGVLKIKNKRHTPPVKHLLKNKLKKMIRDLKEKPQTNASWEVQQADARNLSLEDETIDAVITSPPYLNNIDYTKVYALEQSLITTQQQINQTRKNSLRSHISAKYQGENTLAEIGRITKIDPTQPTPEIITGYLTDIQLSLKETYRILKPGGYAVYDVSNATLPNITVDVDLILAEQAEKIGYAIEDIMVAKCRWAGIGDIRKERPVRESATILKKPE